MSAIPGRGMLALGPRLVLALTTGGLLITTGTPTPLPPAPVVGVGIDVAMSDLALEASMADLDPLQLVIAAPMIAPESSSFDPTDLVDLSPDCIMTEEDL